MLIDWFTVVAQIVNFLILVALMKRFLYGPLLQAIDSREEHISAQLAEADRKDKEAVRKAAELETRISELENRRAQMIEEAHTEADRERHELERTARNSVQEQQAKWQADLDREETAFFQEMRRTAAAEMLAIMRRALADLAGVEIERGAIQAFLNKLRSMDAGVLEALSRGGLTIASATELSADSLREIEQIMESRTGTKAPLRFECAPELAWGVELRGDGQRIGWTPDQYLDSLEEKLRTVLDDHARIGEPVAAG